MTSITPWTGGGRRSFDPFGWDVWDPFDIGVGVGGWDVWDGGRRGGRDETTSLARTNVDWVETPDAHIFHADLPGVRREDVRVHVEDGKILEISGEKTRTEEKETDTWHRVERGRGRFHRRFRLPEDANMDGVGSTLAQGVLTVTVPKKPEAEKTTCNVTPIDIM